MPWTTVPKMERTPGVEPGSREITYREALNEALSQMLGIDERVFIMGEGVDDPGGVFGTTKGLPEKFGDARVFDTPLAENALTGIAMGAALAGMRPVLVHMRVDFLPISLDQIINHAAKWHYMFGGKVHVPMVIRAITGRGWGSAAQHSQSLQALFANIPGLKVVMPSTPYDAKGLLMAAVADGNPVIFLEHRWLYEAAGHVPEEPYLVPIGKGEIRRKGKDATIVGVSHMAREAVAAAELLANEGIDSEVIDLRAVRPMDSPLVIESVRKTGRLVVADTGWKLCGIGAELVARVAEEALGELKAPPLRINIPDVPTPSSPVLEEAYYPGKDDIAAGVRQLLGK
ncbi:MAG: alpha-ketoacid dehydrogenase subunit beta [Thermodesulfobacteriota bacterium]